MSSNNNNDNHGSKVFNGYDLIEGSNPITTYVTDRQGPGVIFDGRRFLHSKNALRHGKSRL